MLLTVTVGKIGRLPGWAQWLFFFVFGVPFALRIIAATERGDYAPLLFLAGTLTVFLLFFCGVEFLDEEGRRMRALERWADKMHKAKEHDADKMHKAKEHDAEAPGP